MFDILKIPAIKKLLVLTLLIRLLIMPFYFHPDIKTYNFQASFLKKGVFNIYDYLSSHKDKLPLKDEFVYFPLTYYFLGAYQILASPILGTGFEKWLADASSISSVTVGAFRYLFILKLPYLMLDILVAFFLANLFTDLQTKKKIMMFWLLNPFSIILIYVYSNVDIFPVFLTVLSLYFARKNNLFLSALSLGVGGGFKAFPILLVPFLFSKASKLKDRIVILLLSLGTFALSIIPFIRSSAFRESTLASGFTTRIISSGLDIGFNEILIPTIILLSILFFWSLSKPKIELWRYYIVGLLLVLVSIHFHIQWLLWIIPFLTIVYIIDPPEDKVLISAFLLIAFFIPLLYLDKFMTVGLFKAISPFYESIPIPAVLINKIYNLHVIESILHSILFGIGLLLSMKIIKRG